MSYTCVVGPLYTIKYREDGEVQFRDVGEQMSCDECVVKVRQLFSEDPLRDFQVVYDDGADLASKLQYPKISKL